MPILHSRQEISRKVPAGSAIYSPTAIIELTFSYPCVNLGLSSFKISIVVTPFDCSVEGGFLLQRFFTLANAFGLGSVGGGFFVRRFSSNLFAILRPSTASTTTFSRATPCPCLRRPGQSILGPRSDLQNGIRLFCPSVRFGQKWLSKFLQQFPHDIFLGVNFFYFCTKKIYV